MQILRHEVDEKDGQDIPGGGYSLFVANGNECLETGAECLEIIGNLPTPLHPKVRDILRNSRNTIFVSAGPGFLNEALQVVSRHSTLTFTKCLLEGLSGLKFFNIKYHMCSAGGDSQGIAEAPLLRVAFPCKREVWLPTARFTKSLSLDGCLPSKTYQILSTECKVLETLSIERARVTLADLLLLCTIPKVTLRVYKCRYFRQGQRPRAKDPISSSIRSLTLHANSLKGRDISLLLESISGLEDLSLQVPLGPIVATSLQSHGGLKWLRIPRCMHSVAQQGIVLPQVTTLFVPQAHVEAAPWIWSVFPNAKEDYFS